jgi:hypothetical protein
MPSRYVARTKAKACGTPPSEKPISRVHRISWLRLRKPAANDRACGR